MWISSRVFQQIVSFFGEIVAYQELHALRKVTLLTSSIQPLRRGKRENKRKEKTSERAAHFLQSGVEAESF